MRKDRRMTIGILVAIAVAGAVGAFVVPISAVPTPDLKGVLVCSSGGCGWEDYICMCSHW